MNDNEKDRKGRQILSAMEHIDPDLISEAEPGRADAEKPAQKVVKLSFFRKHAFAIATAACAILVLTGVLVVGHFLKKPTSDTPIDVAIAGTEAAPKTTVSPVETKAPAVTMAPVEEKPGEEVAGRTDSDGRHDLSEYHDVAMAPGSIDRIVPGGVTIEKELGPATEKPDAGAPPIAVDPEMPEPPVEPIEPPEDGKDKYGLLTAGRWNDNENWGFFKNLVNTGKIKFPAYGLDPIAKTAVTVKNEAGEAVKGVKVQAIYSDDETTVWTAVTNDEGVAYIFLPAVEDRTWKLRAYDAEGNAVFNGTETYAFSGKKEEGVPESQARTTGHPDNVDITVDTVSFAYKDTQVMFILDTTGSMGDELTYLQGEFGHIMEQVTASGVSYSWNFYRDEGDDYVTRTNGFSTDLKELRKILNNESADGGGDTPEAVAEILTETMNSTAWNADSKKLAFLIFDAPPHDEKANVVAAAIAKAAERGIHVVPVVASNADRETELFGRALAIMTDGEYVFLTDDSGIGGSHLEPIIGDYEVEKLGDIIVDIINTFAVK